MHRTRAETPQQGTEGHVSTAGCVLSNEELEVMHLVAAGLNDEAVARHLKIEQRAVESHVSSIRAKLRLNTRLDIVLYSLAASSTSARQS